MKVQVKQLKESGSSDLKDSSGSGTRVPAAGEWTETGRVYLLDSEGHV